MHPQKASARSRDAWEASYSLIRPLTTLENKPNKPRHNKPRHNKPNKPRVRVVRVVLYPGAPSGLGGGCLGGPVLWDFPALVVLLAGHEPLGSWAPGARSQAFLGRS